MTASEPQHIGKPISKVPLKVDPKLPSRPAKEGGASRPRENGLETAAGRPVSPNGEAQHVPSLLPGEEVTQLRAELRAELHRFGESFLTSELRKIAGRIEDNVLHEVRRMGGPRPSHGSHMGNGTNGYSCGKSGSEAELCRATSPAHSASMSDFPRQETLRSGGCWASMSDFPRQETLKSSGCWASEDGANGIADDADAVSEPIAPTTLATAEMDGEKRYEDPATRLNTGFAKPAPAGKRGGGRLTFLDRGYRGPGGGDDSVIMDAAVHFHLRHSTNKNKKNKKSFFAMSRAAASTTSSFFNLTMPEAFASGSPTGTDQAQSLCHHSDDAKGEKPRPPFIQVFAGFMESQEFDALNAFFILSNAATVGAQTNYLARNVTDQVPAGYRIMEIIFAVIFSTELALRALFEQRQFFRGPQWRWNVFDTIVVGMQVAEELLAFAAFGSTTSFMRAIRLLRLCRILRIVRILRLIGELRMIISSIVGSLRHVCWTLVLLALVIYGVGIYLTQMVSNHAVELKQLGGSLSPDEKEFFGDLGSSVSTLFESIAGGVDWYTYTRPLGTTISPLVPIIVVSYIAFTMFAILNSVTGVFVESASKTARHDTEQFVLGLAQNLLSKVDLDGNGHITWDEFRACLEYPEMQLYFESLELDVEDAAALFKLLDFDASGTVSYAEFLQGCFRLRGAARAIEFASFLSAYNDFVATNDRRWLQLEASVKTLTAMTQKLTRQLAAGGCHAHPSQEARGPPARPKVGAALLLPQLPHLPQPLPQSATAPISAPPTPTPGSAPAPLLRSSSAALRSLRQPIFRSPPMPLREEGISVHPARLCNTMALSERSGSAAPPLNARVLEKMHEQQV